MTAQHPQYIDTITFVHWLRKLSHTRYAAWLRTELRRRVAAAMSLAR